MNIADIITSDRISRGAQVSSKKRALEALSELLVKDLPTLTPGEVFDCLLARERLGSTAIGNGVAIPHGRLKNQEQSIGAFIKLDEGIDFDAADGGPVTLLCALLVPDSSSEEHLQILALLAEMFSDVKLCEALRAAGTESEIYGLLTHWHALA